MKDASTIPQFCDGHSISRTHFYELVRQGQGPRLMKVGRRTLISCEAAAEWRKRMEAQTATPAEFRLGRDSAWRDAQAKARKAV